MPEQLALAEVKEAAPQLSGLALMNAALQKAIEQGSALEVVDRLVKARSEAVEYAAKIAFDQAMQRTQSKVKRVIPDATNPQTHSRYASYAKLDAAIRPVYSEEGFAPSFDTQDCDKTETVRVVCYLSHNQGHTRTYHIDMPADGKGAKGGDVMTRTHATGSAVSYGKRYLLGMIFNVTVGEQDDDGNAASGGQGKSLNDQAFIEHRDNIANAATKADVSKFYIRAIKAAGEIGDKASIALFEQEAQKRVKEL